VLIIEDEEVLARNLQAYFHRCGWVARIARTGKSAVVAAAEFRPWIILLDYHLPDMNGFEAFRAIRAVHCCSCVLMTAYREEEEVLAGAQRLGIARILSKPFPIAALQTQLRETATAFCSSCFENGRLPNRSDCGAFAPT
jgi:DNA-binding response OmpR family regulator